MSHNKNEDQQQEFRDVTKQLIDLEASIIAHIGNIQKYRKRVDCFYYENEGEQPVYNDKSNYYSEFWKTFIINQFMVNQLKQLTENVSQFDREIKTLEAMEEQYMQFYKQKNRKKNRRLSSEISKQFKCPYQNCYKVYGTDVSLNLHMKIKHNGGNKTQREQQARQYVRALKLNQSLPEITVNFPPGYLQNFMEQYDRTQSQNP